MAKRRRVMERRRRVTERKRRVTEKRRSMVTNYCHHIYFIDLKCFLFKLYFFKLFNVATIFTKILFDKKL